MILRASVLLAALGLFTVTTSSATPITSSLGNTNPTYPEGRLPIIDIINDGQQAQPPPFNETNGHELFGPSFNLTWTHTYGAISDPILSSNLTIGIWEHDSAVAGDQVASFTLGAVDLTPELNTLFNSHGGASGTGLPDFLAPEYNLYTINFPTTVFTDLADGSVDINLQLQNSEGAYNGGWLISSNLTIVPIPLPSTAWLSLAGLAMLTVLRKRRAPSVQLRRN